MDRDEMYGRPGQHLAGNEPMIGRYDEPRATSPEPAGPPSAGPYPPSPEPAGPPPVGPYPPSFEAAGPPSVGPYPPSPEAAGPPPVGPYPPSAHPGAGDWWTPRRKATVAGAALALALGSGLTGAGALALVGGVRTVYASPTVVQAASNNGVSGIPAIARAVQPSVVSITVTTPTAQDEGSGIILRSDGTILTNNHVVAGTAQGGGTISVKFNDGKSAPATIVGTDPTSDLAVIKASGVSGLKPATLGDSDKLQVGDSVVAIGSPLGLSGSVTNGIVSALHRTLSESSSQTPQYPPGLGGLPGQSQQQPSSGATIGDAIQTDTSINPGNSGGPLVNGSGQVIGINTAIATSGSSNGSIGLGFAIPVNTARQVADQLMTTGKATHAYLGVSLTDATGNQSGALLTSVQNGSPAATAGLATGDLITKANGQPIDGGSSLAAVIRVHRPGDRITLTYLRGNRTSTRTVTLTGHAG